MPKGDQRVRRQPWELNLVVNGLELNAIGTLLRLLMALHEIQRRDLSSKCWLSFSNPFGETQKVQDLTLRECNLTLQPLEPSSALGYHQQPAAGLHCHEFDCFGHRLGIPWDFTIISPAMTGSVAVVASTTMQ